MFRDCDAHDYMAMMDNEIFAAVPGQYAVTLPANSPFSICVPAFYPRVSIDTEPTIRLIPPRIQLQKSISSPSIYDDLLDDGRAIASGLKAVSTPSIIAVEDIIPQVTLTRAKSTLPVRITPPRLPLQKSISTPSIIAVEDVAPEPTIGTKSTLPVCIPSHTESETEEEVDEAKRPIQSYGNSQISLHEFLHDADFDNHSEKRRKRGSLFFRKKKDKAKKMHQWAPGAYATSSLCDWCAKPIANKPALFCENCNATVHQNACKEYVNECKKSKSTTKSSFALPHSRSNSSKRNSGSGQTPSNNQLMGEDKDGDHYHPTAYHHDSATFPDDVPIVPLEFLVDIPLTAADLCADPILGLQTVETDTWGSAVGKDIAKKLKDKEAKRQEHIYEFILTEKHHCLTLLVMQKVFVDGLQKYFSLGANVERMFPKLNELTELHLRLLSRLRQRQREAPIVATIADILLEQFSPPNSLKFFDAYGEFCSRHRDALETYKQCVQNDARFAQFVRHCQLNPLLKKKGIPECILFVTQRLTKYPLLIEPLIKTSKDNALEQQQLGKALAMVKEILTEVDAKVAEKEKHDRKLEMYHRIDAKSYTTYRKEKFKKSDILQEHRSLRFEGVATLMQGRGKMQLVNVIVLSDVLFFLVENSQKYSFFTPDNKAGVVSLQKLLVREKAGQDRSIYLISSNPSDPEMFELKVQKPKDKVIWINAIRSAVQCCPEEDDDLISLTTDDLQKNFNSKMTQIRQLVGLLRQKDVEQAILLEEKMHLQLRLLKAADIDAQTSLPSYRHLVADEIDTNELWKNVCVAIENVNKLASSLYASGTNLSRSVSSVGEHQSDAYVSPTLPKRAETFSGFDNAARGPFRLFDKKTAVTEHHGDKPNRKSVLDSVAVLPTGVLSTPTINTDTSAPALPDLPALFNLGQEQQLAAVQICHYAYVLLSVASQQVTTIHNLKSQLAAYKSSNACVDKPSSYKHNQQLEELRNLQDRLSMEKTAWQQHRDTEERELDEKKQELIKLQEQLKTEQKDIKEQREQLYRKMEVLYNQKLLFSPNIALPITPYAHEHHDEHADNSGSTSPQTADSSPTMTTTTSANLSLSELKRIKHYESSRRSKSSGSSVKNQLPLNLISATNQEKVSTTSQMPFKQQLPLKLASRLSTSTSHVHTVTAASSLSVPQQMLPLKLSQTDDKVRRSSTGYQRLGSGSFSPPSGNCDIQPIASHSRAGSSPAIMPLDGPVLASSSSTNGKTRTHTYPKLPAKYQMDSPERGKKPPKTEEEVIFF